MARSRPHAAGASLSPVLPDRAINHIERRHGTNMQPPPGEVTLLLRAWACGDRDAEARLFELVVPDLNRMAEYLMRKERPDHTIQPRALVDEAYCRLVKARERDWENRQHFFRFAGRIMRHFLIDYARRPKLECVPLERIEQWLCASDDMLEQGAVIGDLLNQLESSHADWCTIVELKFFVGFSDQETAEALKMPLRTMQRKFGDVRRWLFEKLETRPCPASKNMTNF
jgi:RNA polymerase sigma-70 factor, ECF subfamily